MAKRQAHKKEKSKKKGFNNLKQREILDEIYGIAWYGHLLNFPLTSDFRMTENHFCGFFEEMNFEAKEQKYFKCFKSRTVKPLKSAELISELVAGKLANEGKKIGGNFFFFCLMMMKIPSISLPWTHRIIH